jgi:Mrp family chromosome partitioning ATPase
MHNQELQNTDEYYKVLYQRMRTLLTERDGAAVGVTSCVHGEGVTTVASQLAQVAALEQDRPVLLVNANVQDACSERGLSDILAGHQSVDSVDPDNVICATSVPHVSLLRSGTTVVGNSHCTGDRFKQTVSELRKTYPWVFVDLPPAGGLNDCLTFASGLDGILLVVEAERVRNQVVRRTKEQLLQAGAILLGVVFNKRKNHVPDWLYHRL